MTRGTVRLIQPGGRAAYRPALEWQRSLARRRMEGEIEDDLLLLLEHEPVLTVGRNAEESSLRADPGRLEAEGIDVVEVERGGDVTYHGPGQLVGYPVFDLRRHRKDLHWFLRRIEAALIAALRRYGLAGFRVEGHTGVWVGEPEGDVPEEDAPALVASGRARKIASIGVHVSRWVSWHGFALNVTEEPLRRFELIVPCGIQGVRMTSVSRETGSGATPRSPGDDGARDAAEAVVAGFEEAFEIEVRPADGPVAPWVERASPAGGRTGTRT